MSSSATAPKRTVGAAESAGPAVKKAKTATVTEKPVDTTESAGPAVKKAKIVTVTEKPVETITVTKEMIFKFYENHPQHLNNIPEKSVEWKPTRNPFLADCGNSHNYPSTEDWLCLSGTNTPAQVCFIGEVHNSYLKKPGFYGYTIFLRSVSSDVTKKLDQLCSGFAVNSKRTEDRGRPQQEDESIRVGINYGECFGLTRQQVNKDGMDNVPFPKVKDARGVSTFINDMPDVTTVDGNAVSYNQKVAVCCYLHGYRTAEKYGVNLKIVSLVILEDAETGSVEEVSVIANAPSGF